MKEFIKIIIILLTSQLAFCQVSNDSCLSATVLDPALGMNISSCFTGEFGFDVQSFTSNYSAVPNIPYPSMTNCRGYTSSTSSLANDVWFKLKTRGGSIHVYNFKDFTNKGIDTLQLNIWHGTSCSNLQPSACYTFDLSSNTTQVETFCGDTLNNEYTYLQFSGYEINKTGSFGFCIKGQGCSLIWYFGTTKLLDIKNKTSINLYPNPFNTSTTITIPVEVTNVELALFNLHGNLIRKINMDHSNNLIFNKNDLMPGLYILRVTDLNTGKRIVKNLTITD